MAWPFSTTDPSTPQTEPDDISAAVFDHQVPHAPQVPAARDAGDAGPARALPTAPAPTVLDVGLVAAALTAAVGGCPSAGAIHAAPPSMATATTVAPSALPAISPFPPRSVAATLE